MSRRDALQAAAAGSVVLMARPFRRSWRAQVPPEGIEVAPGLTIIDRSVWAGTDHNPTRSMPAEDVRFLLVHHTASSNKYGPDGVIPILQSAYNLHVGAGKGFADIAYNFLIDRFGRVWEGRTGSIEGSVTADATGGSQGFAQLVCLIGDFTNELPTPEAVDALTRTLAWMADRFGVDTSAGATVQFVSRGSNKWAAGEIVVAATICGHRDMSATACPGDAFYPVVRSEFQAIVTAFRDRAATAAAATTAGPTTTVAPSTTVAPTALTAPSTVSETTESSSIVSATSSSPSAAGATFEQPNSTVAPTSSGESGRTALGLGAGAVGLAAVVGGIAVVRRGRRDDTPPPDP